MARRPPNKGFLVGAFLLVLTLIIAIVAARPGPDTETSVNQARAVDRATTAPGTVAAPAAAGLTARQAHFDFGTPSMAAGKVSHRFWFRNNAAAPLMIKRIYTSCMCTTATLVKAMRIVGSYGMAGHGPMPDVNESFAPGEAACVDVVFDPAAHGPAGLGHTERVASIETDARQRLQLAFVANVRPWHHGKQTEMDRLRDRRFRLGNRTARRADEEMLLRSEHCCAQLGARRPRPWQWTGTPTNEA